MNTHRNWLVSFLFLSLFAQGQNFKGVYKIDPLLKQVSHEDTSYIINFWATWCKPCVEELPAFDSLYAESKNTPVKVILVSLDFKEELNKKVIPFLIKHNIKAPCVLLDEVNGNDFIDKISPSWSGAIPATLFKRGEHTLLVEKKMNKVQLTHYLQSLSKH